MEIFSTAFMLFLIMDPHGNVPIFVSMLKAVPPARRNRVLFRELVISLFALIAFLYLGEGMLNLLHLQEEAVSVSGAIILFLIAIKMIFPPSGGGGIMGDTPDGEPFIVPLAIPLIAGPSIMATLILMSNQHPGQSGKLLTALLLAWSASSVILMYSNKLMKVLGSRGVIAIERLMGMILVMIAVQMFLDGVANYML